MLDKETMDIVKSTIPALAAAGPSLTGYFYNRMFTHNPELKNIFNQNNQRNGDQREALFNAVHAYAANIDNIAVLLPAVEKIAQKHASLNILPEHYPIVGKHLLATIEELLNPPKEVLEAWGKAYGVLAEVFIKREEEIYKQNETVEGGWRGTRPFKIVKKEKQSDVITSFVLEPEDGGKIPPYRPGQYIAVYLPAQGADEYQEIRQYSLTSEPNGKYYRIAVKREEKGKVSNHLHDEATEGDSILLAPPCGDFFLDVKPDVPVTLISAGVGQTPMLSMLNSLVANKHQAHINWLHCARNSSVHAFKGELSTLQEKLPSLTHHVWYSHPLETDVLGKDFDTTGFMDLNKCPLKDKLFVPGMQFYFCGPVPFMKYLADQLISLGAPVSNIHYECFGPHKVVN
eukprot:gene2300-2839_t